LRLIVRDTMGERRAAMAPKDIDHFLGRALRLVEKAARQVAPSLADFFGRLVAALGAWRGL